MLLGTVSGGRKALVKSSVDLAIPKPAVTPLPYLEKKDMIFLSFILEEMMRSLIHTIPPSFWDGEQTLTSDQ